MEKENEVIETIRKFTKDENAQFIKLDDTFKFKCQQCGQCCMHRHDIILNPFDVYNGAKYLGITTDEFVSKYLDVELGADSKIPMLLLKSDERTGFCPFLKFDVKGGGKFKCSIHAAKPGACANHPIGVITSHKMDSEDDSDDNIEELSFIKVEQCDNSKSDNDVLVRDWVKSYTDNIEEIRVAHEIQTYMTKFFMPSELFKLCSFIIRTKKASKLEDAKDIFGMFLMAMETVVHSTIGYGYIEYDTNKPFLEQARKNKEELKGLYEAVGNIFKEMKEACGLKEDDNIDKLLDMANAMFYNKDTENLEGGDADVNN